MARLDVDGEGQGVDDAGELHQRAVAHQLDDGPLVLGRLGLDQLLAVGLELRERALFVGGHEAALTDDVGGQYGGEAALHWRSPLATEISEPPRKNLCAADSPGCQLIVMPGRIQLGVDIRRSNRARLRNPSTHHSELRSCAPLELS